MKLSIEIRELIQQIRDSYSPNKIILFGSTAKSGPKIDRDIDLLIIKNTKRDLLKRSYEVRKGLTTNLPLDILVCTPKEVKKRFELGDTFIKEIFDTGKTVYEKK